MAYTETIDLEWAGPFAAGNFPVDFHGRSIRGVYILHSHFEKAEPANRDAFYVGSVSSSSPRRTIPIRIREHYTSMLGFGSWLRDSVTGKWDAETNPDKFAFERFNNLRRSLEQSARVVERLRVYYAEMGENSPDLILRTEAALIVYLKGKYQIDNGSKLPVASERIELQVRNSFANPSSGLCNFLPREISS